MAIDHGLVVLAGILPNRKDLLLHAVQHLEAEHFFSEAHKVIYRALDRYYDISGGVMPKATLTDLLSGSQSLDASKALLFEEAFAEAESLEVADHEFRYAISALKDRRSKHLTGEAITTAFEILERGAEVGKDRFEGHKEARDYAISQFAEIDKLENAEAAPEGDMMVERDQVLADYMDRKEGKTGIGIMTGIPSLDKVNPGGFANGELIVAAAFTNAGKTQFCCQTAWDAAVVQGKNVFFSTSETVRGTVMRRIIARHSRLPQFGLSKGLDSNDIRRGSLSPQEEKALVAVVDDLKNNPAYGKLYIAQIPRGATLSYVESRMNRQQALWDIELAIMDYLALLKSDRKRTSEREELNEIIKEAKVYSTTFADGRGVPFLTPWQIRRESYQLALQTGAYGLSSLSDTAEIEKSADQIMSFLRMQEQPNQVSAQYLKMRDGEIPNAITLQTDFRNAFLGDKTKSTGFGGGNSFGI